KKGSPEWRISDDVQDTLEKILRECEEILSGRVPNIPGYVLQMLRNDRIDKWRKAKRETKGHENYKANFAVGLATSAGPAAEAQKNLVVESRDVESELSNRIPKLISTLSPRENGVMLKWVSDPEKSTSQT